MMVLKTAKRNLKRQIFISYAHEDYNHYREFHKHLISIERNFSVSFWADKRLKAGDYWSKKIEAAINDSSGHIMLISPSFFYSDYIFKKEVPAIQARLAMGALVVPVVLCRCAWAAFLHNIQACPVNSSGKLLPIVDWRPQSIGFDAAREQIELSLAARLNLKSKGWI